MGSRDDENVDGDIESTIRREKSRRVSSDPQERCLRVGR